MTKQNTTRNEMMDLEEKIYGAYIETLDWSLCDYDPKDFVCDYFDEVEYESFREYYIANIR